MCRKEMEKANGKIISPTFWVLNYVDHIVLQSVQESDPIKWLKTKQQYITLN